MRRLMKRANDATSQRAARPRVGGSMPEARVGGDRTPATPAVTTRRSSVAEALGLERNIVAVSIAMFLLALGEHLWKRFLPKYLEMLGAPIAAIGFFGTCEDFLDGVYQYPGGWIGDRYGRRRALLLFVALAAIGYALYWLAPSWPFVFAGLVFVTAWSSMASPTLFAVVGDALPKDRRALGFTVQSILRRVPIALAPTLGGLAIAAYGLRSGVHLGLAATVVLAVVTLGVVSRVNIPVTPDPVPTDIVAVWRSLPSRRSAPAPSGCTISSAVWRSRPPLSSADCSGSSRPRSRSGWRARLASSACSCSQGRSRSATPGDAPRVLDHGRGAYYTAAIRGTGKRNERAVMFGAPPAWPIYGWEHRPINRELEILGRMLMLGYRRTTAAASTNDR